MWRRLGVGLAALAMVSASGARAQEKPTDERAIGALTSFALAYSAWIWEGRCQELDAAARADFQHKVEAALLRLNSIFDEDVVGAAVGAGRSTADDPELGACTPDNAGTAAFGVDMIDTATAALATIPDGYRLTITP